MIVTLSAADADEPVGDASAGAMEISLRVPLAAAAGNSGGEVTDEKEGDQEGTLPANVKVHMVGLQLRGVRQWSRSLSYCSMKVYSSTSPSPGKGTRAGVGSVLH